MKIVINRCFGGFGLSKKAILRYLELKNITPYFYKKGLMEDIYKESNKEEYLNEKGFMQEVDIYTKPLKDMEYDNDSYFSYRGIERTDKSLIQVVEEMGDEVNNFCSKLEVITIPDDVEYEIDDYDGLETIHEKHRSW